MYGNVVEMWWKYGGNVRNCVHHIGWKWNENVKKIDENVMEIDGYGMQSIFMETWWKWIEIDMDGMVTEIDKKVWKCGGNVWNWDRNGWKCDENVKKMYENVMEIDGNA